MLRKEEAEKVADLYTLFENLYSVEHVTPISNLKLL